MEPLKESQSSVPRVKSAGTLAIESAYQEGGFVNLLEDAQAAPLIDLPLDITNVAAMDAACEEIKERILKKGSISAAESAGIIQEKMRVLKLVWSHFPGALSSAQVLECFQKVVEPRGYTDDNVLFAQSICPDEINHEEGDITDLFTKYCGEVFHMGGLAGKLFARRIQPLRAKDKDLIVCDYLVFQAFRLRAK